MVTVFYVTFNLLRSKIFLESKILEATAEMVPIKHQIKKNSFIGMTFPQRMILKGFSYFIGKEVYGSIDNRQEAIDYLVSEH